ncbi:MAG: ATP-binding cassette domain-containing protein [Gammaproteobacteria bacterium]|nr:ATP-binding cassette domain-containing protein [Gammaproteobacteria bacterium]NIR85055.1 ATP-binding cassette domain-containing protein [Gammaproteobacteria bacterium]NIR88322.1 ATP-binding cassette domain-containing protein [Gammaproteobacteria bacterium]NIU06102.1 ATP-binding cassette domain-containing protein [Gammaproteobacteria bacterium]NIV73521.1 ATP-binding cassette domain-containing protein [Gammaproteobacteria bacterium]
MLKVDAITVLMGTLNILRGLSLEVDAGAIVGLVGRNGAGKTTTLRSIMGLVPVTQGDVTLDGRSLLRLPAHERAALGIGYLPEDRRLVGTLSVEENLRVPAEALKLGAPRERLETIYGYLPELKEIASRKAVQLSGGQQKLVALGRSFVHGRRALLLDEPFEGISTAFSRRLAQVIKDYQATEPKLSVLVAESDFKRVAMLTDRAYVIERGEVIEETTTVA